MATYIYTLLFMAALLSADVPAAKPAAKPAEELALKVEATYAAFSDVTIDFNQIYLQKARGRLQAESGKLYVARPKKLRWDYLSPKQKFFVYDGTAAYFYVVEDAQVIKDAHFEKSKLSSALGFLWGEGALLANFKAGSCQNKKPEICPAGRQCSCLLLEPKEPIPEVERMELMVDKENFLVHGAFLNDPLGNETTYVFSAYKLNSGLNDAWFKFVPPDGITVLEQGH